MSTRMTGGDIVLLYRVYKEYLFDFSNLCFLS